MSSISFGHDNSGIQVGNSHGPIYISKGMITEAAELSIAKQTESRPEPLWTVPFPRDPDFVGRHEILDRIQERTSIAGSRVALVGLGGVGHNLLLNIATGSDKNSLARGSSGYMPVTPLAAKKASETLPIEPRFLGVKTLFGNWLQDEKLGKWILVLDNVDDDELLRRSSTLSIEGQIDISSHAPDQPSLRYLLSTLNRIIIITSRNRGVALDVVQYKNLIENKLSTSAEPEKINKLAQELEFIPLAIVQTTSYIVYRRYSVSQYLLKLQKSDRNAVHLLSEEARLLYQDWEAKNSQISIDYIRRIRVSVIDLLSLISFFDRQGILETILRITQSLLLEKQDKSTSEQDIDNKSSKTDIYLEKDLLILGDFSLILDRETDRTFVIYRLCGHSYRLKASLSSGRGSLSLFCTLYFRLTNIRIGKHVSHSFLISNRQYYIDQSPIKPYTNRLLCFIGVHGMRRRVDIS
ncbi:hypothetical protein N7470_008727 [Penicillium chermesinum]|nr:hypothetical protein N7470_008727 [Penicillium chermesinum]